MSATNLENVTAVHEASVAEVPFNVSEHSADSAAQSHETQIHGLRRLVQLPRGDLRLATESAQMEDLNRQIDRIAALESAVLLSGETGTGKTTAARLIHDRSPRCDGPFVVVNCSAIPHGSIGSELFGHARGAFDGAAADRPGRIELADGGTLLIDAVDELPLALQRKLLTLLQEQVVARCGSQEQRQVDVRLVVATDRDLAMITQTGSFLPELFNCINMVPIQLPTLRGNTEYITSLVDSIIARIVERNQLGSLKLTNDCKLSLQSHCWPGNIRELEAVLEHAVAATEGNTIEQRNIRLGDWSRRRGGSSDSAPNLAGRTLADIEKQAIIETLEFCKGNKARTARTLGISEKSIYNKMRRHGLLI